MSRFYTVHAPPGPDAPERFAFIKDGISWPALFVPILWILWHRLWLTLAGAVIFVLLIAWAARLGNGQIATILAIIGAVLFALEANNIRRLSLARRGWRDVGSSFGKTMEEAEIAFFAGWNRPASPAGRQAPPETVPRSGHSAPQRREPPSDRSDEPIFGLFPEPER